MNKPELETQLTWQTKARGSNEDEYEIYVDAGRRLGWEIKTYEEWLNS